MTSTTRISRYESRRTKNIMRASEEYENGLLVVSLSLSLSLFAESAHISPWSCAIKTETVRAYPSLS